MNSYRRKHGPPCFLGDKPYNEMTVSFDGGWTWRPKDGVPQDCPCNDCRRKRLASIREHEDRAGDIDVAHERYIKGVL